jgi:hypothetical protein
MWRAEFWLRDGKPVIMIHGGLSNSNYFGNVIPFLVSEGFHGIAVGQPWARPQHTVGATL